MYMCQRDSLCLYNVRVYSKTNQCKITNEKKLTSVRKLYLQKPFTSTPKEALNSG